MIKVRITDVPHDYLDIVSLGDVLTAVLITSDKRAKIVSDDYVLYFFKNEYEIVQE